MKTRFFVLGASLFCLPALVYSETVNFECNVRDTGSGYEDFLQKLATDQSQQAQSLKNIYVKSGWWQFWKKDSYKVIFSVEGNTNEVFFPLNTTLEVSPSTLVFTEYFCGQGQCNAVSNIYEMNLQTGDLNGEKFAADASWEPFFKSGQKMWDVKGKCRKSI